MIDIERDGEGEKQWQTERDRGSEDRDPFLQKWKGRKDR